MLRLHISYKLIILALIAIPSCFIFSISTPTIVEAHRSGCHAAHSCPSDTGSYTCGDQGLSTYCSDEGEYDQIGYARDEAIDFADNNHDVITSAAATDAKEDGYNDGRDGNESKDYRIKDFCTTEAYGLKMDGDYSAEFEDQFREVYEEQCQSIYDETYQKQYAINYNLGHDEYVAAANLREASEEQLSSVSSFNGWGWFLGIFSIFVVGCYAKIHRT